MSESLHHYIVYLPDEGCYGVTKSVAAYSSLVVYYAEGIEYEVFVLNEDLIFVKDLTIGYEESI